MHTGPSVLEIGVKWTVYLRREEKATDPSISGASNDALQGPAATRPPSLPGGGRDILTAAALTFLAIVNGR